VLSKLRRAFREISALLRVRRELDLLRAEFGRAQLSTEALLIDLALLSEDARRQLPVHNQTIALDTEHPIAFSSADHVFPRGTATDVTRAPAYVRFCGSLFESPPSYLDLGCSAGGIVLDFVLKGSVAIGLEGSDYSKRSVRAAWRVIPSNLFTCDICLPFSLKMRIDQSPAKFDVIGAWEVLEHIPESLLPGLLRNIVDHMHSKSLFMGSIATFNDEDRERGIVWHVTVRSREWWIQQFRDAGLEPADVPHNPLDFPRGSGNGPFDWSAVKNPDMGFHVIMKRSDGARN
jgi:hypothetical protein